MQDKEVGKIWKKLKDDCCKGDGCDNHGEMFQLIRKLVEERTSRLVERFSHQRDYARETALYELYIDPKTY
jgi:hypothetical protein